MRTRTLSLGLALLMTGSVFAQHSGHGRSARGSANYTVKSGENDWIIAHRHHLTVPQLHRLNPDVEWKSLRPGEHITVALAPPSHGEKRVGTHHPRETTVAAETGRTYRVADGENDWIIAHRLGTTTPVLRRLNPGVDLARLRTGQKIRIPSTVVARSVNRLHSRYAVINGDDVNVRREASSGAELVTRVDAGIRVVVLDRDGEWYRLRFPHGAEGWVRGGLLKAVHPEPEERVVHHTRHAEPLRAEHDYVAADRVRSHHHAAGRSHAVASTAGHRRRGNTSLPWNASDFSDNGDEGGKILQAASSFRGVRYHWGSMSRSATDCSGFTSQVFKKEGFTIPRTSREQSMSGMPVHSEDLKAGDLVFFHTMRGARVTHVGIYIGHGKFIHASSAGGHVQVNSLAEGYYNHRLVAARRIAKHHSSGTVTKTESAKATAPKAAPAKKEVAAPAPADKPAEGPSSLSAIGE